MLQILFLAIRRSSNEPQFLSRVCTRLCVTFKQNLSHAVQIWKFKEKFYLNICIFYLFNQTVEWSKNAQINSNVWAWGKNVWIGPRKKWENISKSVNIFLFSFLFWKLKENPLGEKKITVNFWYVHQFLLVALDWSAIYRKLKP